jgi:virginiamycin B lyase
MLRPRFPRRLRWQFGLIILLALIVPAAYAAPSGRLRQFRVPTVGSDPKHITRGADGNFWFTESFIESQRSGHKIGRITPGGAIVEFAVCDFCFPNDIVQGPNNILYFSQSDASLGRITTAGQVLDPIPTPPDASGSHNAIINSLAAHGDDLWLTDFNTDSIWRYAVAAGTFTKFPVPTPAADPYDVAVDVSGAVWFTESSTGKIGRIDPATGAISETVVGDFPRHIAVAADGAIWFTLRFSNAIGRLDPATGQAVTFPLAAGAGPEDIAAAPNGAVWFTQFNAGSIAQITANGVISEARATRDSGPYGITIGPDGSPWYVMMRGSKVATLDLR